MIVLYTINFILIGAVSVTAGIIMAYWHRATRGGWRRHPSGRALMKLLGIICFITLNAALQVFIPKEFPIEYRAYFYFALYVVFIWALAAVGFTIRNEVRRGRRHKNRLPETGEVTTIARIAAKEESHD